MGLMLLALFILVPLIEIFGFIQIGGLIGIWPTLGIVILTAIVGSLLLRHQGLNTLLKAEQKIQAGQVPVDQVVDGICLAFAGALLLTPGFFTDFFGLLLFVPSFRYLIARTIFKRFLAKRFNFFSSHHGTQDYGSSNPSFSNGEGPIIDGTYSSKDEDRSRSSNDNHSDNGSHSPWNK